MFKRILTAGLVFGMMGAAPPAQAQFKNCAPRDHVVERLQDRFGEGLAGGGLQSDAHVIEIWAAAETGTWTVLLSRADGVTCVLASGTNWHQQDPGFTVSGVPS